MSANDEARSIAEDSSAQRILNLFFMFNASTRPLSTTDVITDSDLGYGSGQRESDLRKFRRDRAKLAERGIRIIEVKRAGAAETEESFWMLDREHTFTENGMVTPDDAQTLATAIGDYLRGRDTPLEKPLCSVRDKAFELVERGIVDSPTIGDRAGVREGRGDASDEGRRAVLDAIWSAFSSRKQLTFSYIDAQGRTSKRTVAIYGLFSHGGITYFIGPDSASGAVRTFRSDRIERAWRPRGSYAIPADFNIDDHVFLPFDFGDGQAARTAFSFSDGTTIAAVQALTRGRGEVTECEQGRLRWAVDVRDLSAAAAFSLRHAREGMRPIAPDALIEAWKAAIRKAIEAHDA